jgi:ribonuclease BN (tRNA processing enzyme)
MKLRVLGSSGAEFPGHRPPGFLIDGDLLLDAGTIGAVLTETEQWKIRHILLTHAHLDHIRGIPFLADNIILKNKKHSVTVRAIAPVLKDLKKNLLNDRIWPDFTVIPHPERSVIKLDPIKAGKPYDINGYSITAYPVSHSVPATGFVVEDKRGRRLIYTGDTGPTERIWRACDREVHCAIVEVSMPNRMRQMAVMTGHLTSALLGGELKKMKHIPKQLLITHPKPQYHKHIKEELKKLRMNNVRLLEDGETFRI